MSESEKKTLLYPWQTEPVIAPPNGRTIDHKTREPRPGLIVEPSEAQFQYWLAASKRDHGDLGMREMEKVERETLRARQNSITMYNPFTGEIRRIPR